MSDTVKSENQSVKRSHDEISGGSQDITSPSTSEECPAAVKKQSNNDAASRVPVHEVRTFAISEPLFHPDGSPMYVQDKEGNNVIDKETGAPIQQTRQRLKHQPKTKKGKIAYASYEECTPVLLQFKESWCSRFMKFDPNSKNTGKGGKASAATTDKDAADGGDDSNNYKLFLSLDPEDNTKILQFQNEIPGMVFNDKPLLDSLFEPQDKITNPKLRQDERSLTQTLGEVCKAGQPKKDDRGMVIIDEKTKQPICHPDTIFLTATSNAITGLPCCEIWKDNGKDADGNNLDLTMLYGHYEDEAENEKLRLSLEAIAAATGNVIVQPDPIALVERKRITVVARYLGLYKMGKGYGTSWRVVNIILAPPKAERATVPTGTCLLIRH